MSLKDYVLAAWLWIWWQYEISTRSNRIQNAEFLIGELWGAFFHALDFWQLKRYFLAHPIRSRVTYKEIFCAHDVFSLIEAP